MNQHETIRVFIAEEHTLFREGLISLLATASDIRVVGHSADALQTVRMAEALRPEILLLDIRMRDGDGLKALPKILEKSPETKILILSADLEEAVVVESLQYGARGYIANGARRSDLVKAIRAIHGGEIWASRRTLTQVLDGLRERMKAFYGSSAAARSVLTDREGEVTGYVVQGLTNKEIAARLHVSEKTIKTHMSNIFRKLNVSRRLDLLRDRVVKAAE